jgi:hydroxymethylbilane synthase
VDPFRIGTRGSRLALVQSEWVAARLREEIDGPVELVEIRTTGDTVRDRLGPEHGVSFFTKEIEDALLDGRVDFAVHSCKDLATRLPDGLVLGAIPAREDPRDVLVSGGQALRELERGARVGTSSPRRRGFLAAVRDDLTLVDQRGNVPTRVAAVDEGRVDAVVLAAAGLLRLGMQDRVTEYLDVDVMLPAAAQGALAVEVREDDAVATELAARLDAPGTHAAVAAERACLRRLQAGCQAPVGALARHADGGLVLDAAVVAPDGIVRTQATLERADEDGLAAAERLGIGAAEALLAALDLESLAGVAWAEPGPPRRDAGAPG